MTTNMINELELWKSCTVSKKHEVSNFGRIRYKNNTYFRKHLGKIIEVQKKVKYVGTNVTPKGYLRCNLNKRTYFVHRIVAECFLT